MERKAEHDIARKLKVFNHAKEHGNISKTFSFRAISCSAFLSMAPDSKINKSNHQFVYLGRDFYIALILKKMDNLGWSILLI